MDELRKAAVERWMDKPYGWEKKYLRRKGRSILKARLKQEQKFEDANE